KAFSRTFLRNNTKQKNKDEFEAVVFVKDPTTFSNNLAEKFNFSTSTRKKCKFGYFGVYNSPYTSV
ncbi:6799_t:CDS:1, partial [Dentiscutata erythropus]